MRTLPALALAGTAFAAVRKHQKLKLPPVLTSVLAYSVPAALGAGFKRSPVRDMAVWGAHMWAYENAFELPNDDEAKLRRRAHLIVALQRVGIPFEQAHDLGHDAVDLLVHPAGLL